ncbi:MAG: pseudouridine synthase [Pseudanabaenaceae cyanobacterium bins.39]|nr:pseudouridine synthase [Pseudanabaenaceae cyanobacterium bins.39]
MGRHGLIDRLQKILSRYGVASRREAERMILAGRVSVNGVLVKELGTKADPHSDRITIDGQILTVEAPELIYLLLNKPRNVICTRDDPQGRTTVLELLPPEFQHLYPVGRLDYDSSGALLLTNDGEFANCLMHPRHHVPKTYEVWVQGMPSDRDLETWRSGVILDGKMTKPAIVQMMRSASNQSCLQIVLSEGRNRQIRRIAEQLGHPVNKLHRVAIGDVSLLDLRSGNYRSLNNREIQRLLAQAKAP